MTAGRPQNADPGNLYAFAHLFYWDLRALAEGFSRRKLDKAKYETLNQEINNTKLQLSSDQLAYIELKADEAIRTDRLLESERKQWVRSAEDSWLMVIREDLRQSAADEATRRLNVPGEPEVIRQLLEAETSDEIRAICKDAFMEVTCEIQPGVFRKLELLAWPIPAGSVLPSNLSKYASEFIAARKDPRFPRSSDRPTTRLKQLWFLSRALAGALYGVATRTAINLVGSKRPEQVFEESHAAKSVRKRLKRRRSETKS